MLQIFKKNIIIITILLIFLVKLILNGNNIVYSFNIPKNIPDNNFFINTNYTRDVYYINHDFIYGKNLRGTVKKCFKIGEKYFNNKKDIKTFCLFRIKEFLKNINHPLKNKYKYLKYQEENFLYNKAKKPINNILLKYINKKEPENKITKNDENIIKDYLTYYNNGGVNINKIIVKNLENLDTAYFNKFKQHIILNSGYRSIDNQKQIYEKYKKIYGPNQKIATTPGYSEHHLGTTIDIHRIFLKNSKGIIYDNNYTWLKQHAWEYGFIQSYDNNCIKDGIINEDWHYRYVGNFLAQKWKLWKEKNKNKCNIYFLKELNEIKREKKEDN